MKKIISVVTLLTLGATTVSYASIDKNLKYGQRDKEVTELQEFLIDKGLLNTTPSTYFGLLTLKAVKAYQKSIGVSPTGFVGVLTREKINKEIDVEVASSNEAERAEVTTSSNNVQQANTKPVVTNTQPVTTNINTTTSNDGVYDSNTKIDKFGRKVTITQVPNYKFSSIVRANLETVGTTAIEGWFYKETKTFVTEAELAEQQRLSQIEVDKQNGKYTPPVTDVCKNIEGTQTMAPTGMTINADGNCVVITQATSATQQNTTATNQTTTQNNSQQTPVTLTPTPTAITFKPDITFDKTKVGNNGVDAIQVTVVTKDSTGKVLPNKSVQIKYSDKVQNITSDANGSISTTLTTTEPAGSSKILTVSADNEAGYNKVYEVVETNAKVNIGLTSFTPKITAPSSDQLLSVLFQLQIPSTITGIKVKSVKFKADTLGSGTVSDFLSNIRISDQPPCTQGKFCASTSWAKPTISLPSNYTLGTDGTIVVTLNDALSINNNSYIYLFADTKDQNFSATSNHSVLSTYRLSLEDIEFTGSVNSYPSSGIKYSTQSQTSGYQTIERCFSYSSNTNTPNQVIYCNSY